MARVKVSTGRLRAHGRRVFEAVPVPRDACPLCGVKVTLTTSGRVRRHLDSSMVECAGTGLPVGRPVTLVDLPPVVLPEERRVPVKAAGRERAAPARVRLPRGPNSATCGECGRSTPLNRDGSLKAHRPNPDVFVGPHCPGGRPKGRQ